MSTSPSSLKRIVFLGSSALLLAAAPTPVRMGRAQAKEKIKPAELIRRHLGSMGSEAAARGRDKIRAHGAGTLEIISPGEATAHGTVQLLSRGRDFRYSFTVNRADYNGEGAVVEDGEVNVAFATPGRRSFLGEFLFSQKSILQEGLFAGVLSAAWPLADGLQGRKRPPKLKYKRTKKREGQEFHTLRYQPRRSAHGLKITLFFDTGDFTHRRTEYDLRIPAPPSATPTDTARLRDTRVKVEEVFSDFREADGFHLPAQWNIRYSLFGNGLGTVWEWRTRLEGLVHGADLPPDAFSLKAK